MPTTNVSAATQHISGMQLLRLALHALLTLGMFKPLNLARDAHQVSLQTVKGNAFVQQILLT